MTDFEQIPVSGILPQRPPFVFVDKLLHYDEMTVRTSFRIREDTLFVENGRLSSPGIIENMAQSSAARIGYISRYILHIPVRIGYIGNVRKLKIYRLPFVGEEIETTVMLKEEIFGISLTEVEVRCGGEIIAVSAMKTALDDKEAEI